jgi:hypothetical protein
MTYDKIHILAAERALLGGREVCEQLDAHV